ncbi:uncharacterized protein B0T23DRAFT_308027 [Neurospora hispaniola]|uniref:Uncharacterized protein n=1 Tax=Neurospora hispaniola TaxID=588809 RepID=A0AAJ0II25_9PEZI|nr:hypothetical protein B0T23DRAFT_308027 [Neurospora hispaniola]
MYVRLVSTLNPVLSKKVTPLPPFASDTKPPKDLQTRNEREEPENQNLTECESVKSVNVRTKIPIPKNA